MNRFGDPQVATFAAGGVLAFVETAAEVVEILGAPGATELDAFVALTPEAAFAISNLGRPYLKLEDGYDEASLRPLSHRTIDDQKRWASWVDGQLHEHVPAFRKAEFFPTRLSLHSLKVMFDSLSLRIHALDWALRRWQPRQIVYTGHDRGNRAFSWDLGYRESIYPAALRHVASKLRIDARLPPSPDTHVRADPTARAWWLPPPSLKHRIAEVVRNAAGPLWPRDSGPGPNRLLVSASYDLGAVWRLASRDGIPLLRWDSVVESCREDATGTAAADARAWMTQAWAGLSDRPEFRCVLRVADGYDLWAEAEDRLRFWWHVLVPQQWGVYEAVLRRFAAQPPRAIVTAVLVDHLERGIFSAFRSLGVPASMMQHGGFVGSCETVMADCQDISHAQYELTYGSGVTDYLRERQALYGGARAVPISVGSSRLDELRNRFASSRWPVRGRPRILLVASGFPQNDRYLDCGNLPDVTEAEVQAGLVRLAREFPAFDFVLKPFHRQFDTPATRLAAEPGSNCRVSRRATLPSVMATASLIVLTVPSTPLLEAVATDRQVVVFVDRRSMHMFPQAKTALSRRAVLSETVEDLFASLRELLGRGALQPLVAPDQSFIAMYGTHLNDGLSARRALDSLLQNAPREGRS